MAEDLRTHPGEWENHTLDRFLDSLAAYLPGQHQVYVNLGDPYPATPTRA